jgi:hypothetical protein
MHFVECIKNNEPIECENYEHIVNSFFENIHRSKALVILLYKMLVDSGKCSNISTFEKVRDYAIKQSVINEIRTNWLQELECVLTNLDISVVLIKGAALDGFVYPVGTRGGTDVDILLHYDNYAIAVGEMKKYGLLSEKRYEYGFEETWISSNHNNVEIDIHKDLTVPVCYKVNINDIWERSIRSPVFLKNNIRLPSVEDQLIIIAANCARDLIYMNHRLIDALSILVNKNVDYDKLYSIANSWGMSGLLYAQLSVLDMTCAPESNMDLSCLQIGSIKKYFIHNYIMKTSLNNTSKINRRIQQIYSQWLLCDSITKALDYQVRYVIKKAVS